MNKLVKIFTAFAALLIGAVTLVSCGGYNFKDAWNQNGAKVDDGHPFEVIELEDAKAKIDADETFVLVLGNPASSASANSITIMCEQAKVAKFEGTIYFIDVEEEVKKLPSRDKLKTNLAINNPANAASNLLIACYNKQKIFCTVYAENRAGVP